MWSEVATAVTAPTQISGVSGEDATASALFAYNEVRREENCFAGGGGMARKPICPTPPLPLLGRRAGGVGVGLGLPYLPCQGGGGVRPQHTWLKMIPMSR